MDLGNHSFLSADKWEEGNREWEKEIEGVSSRVRFTEPQDVEEEEEDEEEAALLRELEEDSMDSVTEVDDDDSMQASFSGNVPVSLRTIANMELLKITPADIASEFEERLAQLEIDLEESKELAAACEVKWSAKYKDLTIQHELQETEMSTLRAENSELREKLSEYKKNLWVKSVDLNTIKLVEDEVSEAIKDREKDLHNLRVLKDEELRLVKQHHQRDLDEIAAALTDQMDATKAILKQKHALLDVHDREEESEEDDYAPTAQQAATKGHTTLSDPISILGTLKSLGTMLYDNIYKAEDSTRTEDPLSEYKERELKMLSEHIGKTPQELADDKKAVEAADVDMSRKAREALIDSLSKVEDEEAKKVLAALRQYHESEAVKEDERLQTLTVVNIAEDPIFSVLLDSTKFGTKVEAVVRENELLKARLHVLGGGRSGGLGLKELEDKKVEMRQMVDELEERAERLSNQCVQLEEQKEELKGMKKEVAEEVEALSRQAPHLDNMLGTMVDATDSDDTRSVSENESYDEDDFDPTQEMLEQMAGVEPLVEEPEEETKVQYELEQKQFAATMRKEAHIASLVEQILQYLQCGANIFRAHSGQVTKDFAFLTGNRSVINICHIQEGKPNKKATIELIMLRDVKQIVIGQFTDGFKRMLKEAQNKVIDPNELHKVPKDSDQVEAFNTGTYFYRSISLRMRKGKTFNFIANTDNDFETWLVALHRITTIEPKYEKGLETVPFMRGYEVLVDDEKAFCEACHIPPLLYLNSKMQCLKQKYKHYLSLYDVRTLSGFDLLHSQKVFELWLLMSWIEKRFVYQMRYLEIFPEEGSNLVAEIDAARQKERKLESDRLLHA